MSNNANQTKAEVVKQSILEMKREQYEFTIPLPENVQNVLSVDANVTITDFEVLMGQVNFTGEACLNVIFSLTDGIMSNLKECETFTAKIENIGLDPNTLIKILPNVVDIEINKAENSNSINVKLTLDYELNAIKNQGIEIFKNEDPDTFVKESQIEISRHVARNTTTFSQTTIFDTKMPVQQILNTTSTAMITKADSLDNMVIFEGEITTKILYTTEEDRPVIVTMTNKETFREEVEDANATQNSMVEAFARVMNRTVESKINSEEKTIEVNVPVRLCYDLFETAPVTITIDAFSTINDVNLATEAFLSNQVSGYEVIENKIDGNVTLDSQTLRIDKILAVDGAYLTTTNQRFEDGELQIEGIIHSNIIFLNDEQEQVNSISVEIPISFKKNIGERDMDLKVENILTDVDAVVKRGRDIYIDGKVKTSIWINKEVQNAIVTSIENGDPLPQRDGTIEIYFANSGETFWNVAKDLKIPEEMLRAQNTE
ncbi:MAG: DUF3794 domain-containing protein, partial [Clostridia bacterium]|nr:DUF3794 domain-containing protein [Clostridia bacterium]